MENAWFSGMTSCIFHVTGLLCLSCPCRLRPPGLVFISRWRVLVWYVPFILTIETSSLLLLQSIYAVSRATAKDFIAGLMLSGRVSFECAENCAVIVVCVRICTIYYFVTTRPRFVYMSSPSWESLAD